MTASSKRFSSIYHWLTACGLAFFLLATSGCTTTTVSARSGFEVPSQGPTVRGIARWTTDEKIHPAMGVAPVYPEKMISREKEGEVSLEVMVRNTGQVAMVRVIDSTNDYFRESAIAGTRGILYDPTLAGQTFVVKAVYRIQKRP